MWIQFDRSARCVGLSCGNFWGSKIIRFHYVLHLISTPPPLERFNCGIYKAYAQVSVPLSVLVCQYKYMENMKAWFVVLQKHQYEFWIKRTAICLQFVVSEIKFSAIFKTK